MAGFFRRNVKQANTEEVEKKFGSAKIYWICEYFSDFGSQQTSNYDKVFIENDKPKLMNFGWEIKN